MASAGSRDPAAAGARARFLLGALGEASEAWPSPRSAGSLHKWAGLFWRALWLLEAVPAPQFRGEEESAGVGLAMGIPAVASHRNCGQRQFFPACISPFIPLKKKKREREG